jgi:hypothetical protein
MSRPDVEFCEFTIVQVIKKMLLNHLGRGRCPIRSLCAFVQVDASF